jgi:hypothetical protein
MNFKILCQIAKKNFSTETSLMSVYFIVNPNDRLKYVNVMIKKIKLLISLSEDNLTLSIYALSSHFTKIISVNRRTTTVAWLRWRHYVDALQFDNHWAHNSSTLFNTCSRSAYFVGTTLNIFPTTERWEIYRR